VLRRVAREVDKVIAAELDISEGTVKTHMKSILPKLDAATYSRRNDALSGEFRRLNTLGS